jgi:hypothetical protein
VSLRIGLFLIRQLKKQNRLLKRITEIYKRETKRDLTFIQKDFEHPYTSFKIVDYFKKMYPDNYAARCEVMLGMTPEQFKEYNIRKEQFDNR